MRAIALVIAAATLAPGANAAAWREATDAELKSVIPSRAPVEKERIETETRTASGITDGKGKFVAGVVLITAGYSADGKYSHFFITQVPMKVGSIHLDPGEYVFGWKKSANSLTIRFYNAQTGQPLGTVDAPRTSKVGKIEQFHLYAPGDKAIMQVGRFGMPYELE